LSQKVPKRISTAILQSLGAGVVPRIGLEYIAVGRKNEISALLDDLDNIVSEGGASFRLIVGKYGSGKSFLTQLIRNYALQRNYVVSDVDMSPVVRLTGTGGQGQNLYKEIINKIATRTRPEGNAFSAILEKWINDTKASVIKNNDLSPTDPEFPKAVEKLIYQTINKMEGMIHGFDFATVITKYFQGLQTEDDNLKNSALKWLRGEFGTKVEVRAELGIRELINDTNYYDYLKILSSFVTDIGYNGFLIFIDETVNLYKISNNISRLNNYERFLTIYNDILQGKVRHMGFIFCCTPRMIEDTQRGFFSYEALFTRLQESRYSSDDVIDYSGPIIRLSQLVPEEIFVLMQRICEIHSHHYKSALEISDKQIQTFMTETVKRLGAEQLNTPREMIRDFISILNILRQNPNTTFESLVLGEDFKPTATLYDPEKTEIELLEKEGKKEKHTKSYSNFKI
jgi:hypothetical protein